MAKNKAGIEQLIYKADAGDITISGNDIEADSGAFDLVRIVRDTSKGGIAVNGNTTIDTTIRCTDETARVSIYTDEGNFNDLEIYMNGNTGTADYTIPNVNLIINENVATDPSSPSGGSYGIVLKSTFPSLTIS